MSGPISKDGRRVLATFGLPIRVNARTCPFPDRLEDGRAGAEKQSEQQGDSEHGALLRGRVAEDLDLGSLPDGLLRAIQEQPVRYSAIAGTRRRLASSKGPFNGSTVGRVFSLDASG